MLVTEVLNGVVIESDYDKNKKMQSLNIISSFL